MFSFVLPGMSAVNTMSPRAYSRAWSLGHIKLQASTALCAISLGDLHIFDSQGGQSQAEKPRAEYPRSQGPNAFKHRVCKVTKVPLGRRGEFISLKACTETRSLDRRVAASGADSTKSPESSPETIDASGFNTSLRHQPLSLENPPFWHVQTADPPMNRHSQDALADSAKRVYRPLTRHVSSPHDVAALFRYRCIMPGSSQPLCFLLVHSLKSSPSINSFNNNERTQMMSMYVGLELADSRVSLARSLTRDDVSATGSRNLG